VDLARYTALFLSDSREHLQRCNELLLAWERVPSSAAPVAELFRAVHSIKGSSSALGLEPIAEIAHAAEQLLGEVREGRRAGTREVLDALFLAVDTLTAGVESVARQEPPMADPALVAMLTRLAGAPAPPPERPDIERRLKPRPATVEPAPHPAPRQVRVDLDRLDRLVNDVGELMVAGNRLAVLTQKDIGTELEQVSARIVGLVTGLQSDVLRARMTPVAELFERFPRMVRDLCRELGKSVRLELQGSEIELDRSVLDGLADPLTHLLRNAIDHGIEPGAARQRARKPAEGTIRLRAERSRDEVVLIVADDGRGVDRTAIRDRAVERGLLPPDAPLPDAAGLLRLLAHSGVTTKDRVSTVSGRGVGVDAVVSRVRALGGRIELRSQAGQGTVFLLHLPVTRAIVRTLLVEAGGERYAIPFSYLAEAALQEVQGGEVTLRGVALPAADLRVVAGLEASPGGKRPLVVLDVAGRRVALLADALLGRQDVVVERLEAPVGLAPWVGGAAILSDGVPALILDPAALF
jgi:two-component system, chemotaxis family, sensor kinase CheA